MTTIDHHDNDGLGASERPPNLMDLHARFARVEAKTEAVAEDVKEIRVSIDRLSTRDGELEKALANHAIATERTINSIADKFSTMLKEVADRFSERVATLNHDAFKRSDMTWLKATMTTVLAAAVAAIISVTAAHWAPAHTPPVEIVTHP